ncbi:MAG: nucleoside hydrolase [Wenzhouxiangellaceae bacterium]
MSCPVQFPQLSNEELARILRPPHSREKPLRVVMDSDFDNEVDDHFALAWLLLQSIFPSSGLNQVDVEAVIAAPYSFRTRLEALLKAYAIYLLPPEKRTPEQEEYLLAYQQQIEAILALGITPLQLAEDPHLNGSNEGGVNGSYLSIKGMYELFGIPSEGKVFKGATTFMPGPYEPVDSEGARRLIDLARAASPDDPLYVVAIACATDVASALLMAPDILPNIVVIWDAGYPTNVTTLANDSLNLDEDLYASQLLFSSGVPLVYVPGFYIAQQLNMSLPDVDLWFEESGQVGEALYYRYTHNPLFSFYGIDPTHLFGRNWVIWDIANVAWLLNPGSLPSNLVQAPVLTDDKYWQPNPDGHWIREPYQISVNDIFPTFARQLRIWAS